MANAKFYTYIHKKADTGEVFYVGKGKGQRSHTIYNRTKFWRNVVAKHGFVVELVDFFDDEDDALKSEISMIADYRSRGFQLVNLTVGGEGASGQVFTEDRKRKISEALKGKIVSTNTREKISKSLMGRPGRPHSEESKRKLSESQKGRVFSDEHKEAIKKAMAGVVRVYSDEARRKMSEANLGVPKNKEMMEKLRIFNIGKQYSLGSKRTQESLIRMSVAQKGRTASVETKAKLSAMRKGLKPSDETRKRLSESQKLAWAARKAALAAPI